MFSKVSPTCWKVLGVAFTSILAPVGIRHFDDVGHEAPAAEKASATACQKTAPTRILAKGGGASSEAAFQNALDSALHLAIVAEVGAADWKLHSQTYLSALRENGTGVLSGWHEVSSSSERHLTGRVFYSEVSVEVNIEVLRERLRTVDRVVRH
jgi:hypothetical protein